MEKVIVKGFRGVFLSPTTGLTTILLTAAACLLSYIDVAGNTEANRQSQAPSYRGTTLRCTNVTEADTISQSVLNPPQAGLWRSEWQTVRMRVTAYCSCPKCCGKYSDGKTACGHKIRLGDAFVAADKKYPFGTEMIVPGYADDKPVKVLDRGGAIYGNRIDVFFDSHKKALEWGVKHLDVRVHRK